MSPSWPLYVLSHLSPVCLSSNTHHWPPPSVSDFRQESAAPHPCAVFFPFSEHQSRFIKGSVLAEDWDCHSAFLLQHWELSSQAGDLATPWCRRRHLPNVLLSDVCSGGGLGKWPISLSCVLVFPFGKRDSWLSVATAGSGEQDGIGGVDIHLAQVQPTQEDGNAVNWVCQGLVTSLDFFEVTGIRPIGSKKQMFYVLLCKSKQAPWEGGKGK